MKKVKIKLNSEMSVLEMTLEIESALKKLGNVRVEYNTEMFQQSGTCFSDRTKIITTSRIEIDDNLYH